MKRVIFLAAALALVPPAAHAAHWQIDVAKSTLGFVVTWDKEPFRASFKRWTAAIDFDPADIAKAKADVTIDITSFLSEDPENDKYRTGPNGLDVRRFAQARFVSKSFRETGPGRYEAVADLTIHGVTKEVKLPFALAITGRSAHMTGELTLSRVDFGVGTGSTWGIDWSSERTVAHAVKVTVDLVATAAPETRYIPLMETIPPQRATRIEAATEGAVAEAARLLREGRLVAFPTETVYGLGANALDEAAVASVFAAKDRPQFNPLIVHVSGRSSAEAYVTFNPVAQKLADAFWPGALTLVLPRREGTALSLLASAGLDTVAVRSPNHPVARALLTVAGIPIAAPSANRAGSVSPTTAAHVTRDLYGRVDLILDAGPCPLGIEFTVIGFDGGRPLLLRPGAITREAIEDIAGRLAELAKGDVRAPGMMASHYAPRARLRLDIHEVRTGEALLAFGPNVPNSSNPICNLSPRGDLAEAAANLFAMLRQLDQSGVATIAVMRVPDKGLGEAINDRLRRAAAPREATP